MATATGVLNGTGWVSSGTHAGVIIAMARTDRPDHRRGARGISSFVVTPDMPGFTVGKKEDKMGLRASPTVQLVFDNLRVPAANLLGEEGHGFSYAMQSLDMTPRNCGAGDRHGVRLRLTRYAAEVVSSARRSPTRAIQFKLADMAKWFAAHARCFTRQRPAKDR